MSGMPESNETFTNSVRRQTTSDADVEKNFEDKETRSTQLIELDCDDDGFSYCSSSVNESTTDWSCENRDITSVPTRIESQNAMNVQVDHSNDISFGSKTFITGPVVIKHFIADTDTLNINQRDKPVDPLCPPEPRRGFCLMEKCEKYLPALFRRRPILTITTVFVIFSLITGAIICGYLLNKEEGEPPEYTTEAPGTDDPDYFEFISRSDYNALPRRGILLPLYLPVKYVIIAHTEGQSCSNLTHCKDIVRYIQWLHMNINGWDEVGLNFMVGGDGRVYEGSGYEEGAHTLGYNRDSICISLIGSFSKYKPTDVQYEATKKLIRSGINQNKIKGDYVLYAHRQIRGGDSPGDYVYNEIQNWQHFSDEVLPK